MDQWSLDSIKSDELLAFFHRYKTVLSCMDELQTFVSQLTDHGLIPQDECEKMSRMKSRENQKRAVYEILVWFETERPNDIHKFWKCVFEDTIINQYPPLCLLRHRLMDAYPLKNDVPDLPVTCGSLKGSLNIEKLAKGEQCILFQNQWFTPGEFERRAGKMSSKNWKWSIRCNGTPLGKLIEDGQLEAVPYRGGAKKKNRSPPDTVLTDQVSSNDMESSTDDTDEETEQQPEADDDRSNMLFKVTCGAVCGTLHSKRFASGTCGKSIRTERSWMSPVDFAKEALSQTDVYWRKDIEWEGKPLSVLIEKKTLKIHSVMCLCTLCKPDKTDLENQNNDDECFICKRDEDSELVVCDFCPRSFHEKCHLPHIDDAILEDDRKWMCTFCVFRSYTYTDEMGMTDALSRQISARMLQCQYLLLHLCCADEDQTFASDPNLNLSDYSTVIQTPMWLGKVANKLQSREYKTVGEFVSDVKLIFTNCAKFNRENAEFLARGNRLKQLFDREFKSVFNIRK